MSELLFCPFCGGEADTWDGAGPWHVVCTKCGTVGSPCLTEAEAIAAWNTRAERTCKVEGDYWHDHGGDGSDTYEYVLSCGHKVEWLDDAEPPNYCPQCGAKVVSE